MSLTRHTLQNLAGAVAPLVFGVVTVPVFLHLVGVGRYGMLSLVWLVVGYFGLFDLGLARATAYHIARLHAASSAERSQMFLTAAALNMILGLAGAALLFAFLPLLLARGFHVRGEMAAEMAGMRFWIAAAVPMATLNGVVLGALEGRQRFDLLNMSTGATAFLLQLAPLGVALFWGPSLALLVPAVVLARGFSLVATFAAVLAVLPIDAGGLAPRRAHLAPLLRYGGWITISSLASNLMMALDRLLIGGGLGVAAVSFYTVPYNLVTKASILPSAVSTSLFPRLSREETGQAASAARRAVLTLAGISPRRGGGDAGAAAIHAALGGGGVCRPCHAGRAGAAGGGVDQRSGLPARGAAAGRQPGVALGLAAYGGAAAVFAPALVRPARIRAARRGGGLDHTLRPGCGDGVLAGRDEAGAAAAMAGGAGGGGGWFCRALHAVFADIGAGGGHSGGDAAMGAASGAGAEFADVAAMSARSKSATGGLVTVVLPVFNALSAHPDYLPGAIASVLGQSHGDCELIIVDDGSADDYTALRARYDDPRITWLRQENAGQSAARNLGARHGRGRYLAFLDQDDAWKPGWLAEGLAALARDGAALVYCDVDCIDARGALVQAGFFAATGRGRHPKSSLADVIGRDCFVMPSAMLMERALFLTLGGFEETLAGCEDDDLFRRVYLAAPTIFLPAPLVRWRSTGASASFSRRMDESRLRYFRILETAHPGADLRDLVAPRFLLLFTGIYRQAAAAGDGARLALAREACLAVQPHLRRPLALGLSLFLLLPAPVFGLWQRAAAQSRLYGGVMRLLGRR